MYHQTQKLKGVRSSNRRIYVKEKMESGDTITKLLFQDPANILHYVWIYTILNRNDVLVHFAEASLLFHSFAA